MCNLNRNWYRSNFPRLKFLWYFDLFSGKRSRDLQCSILLYSLFEPSVCRRSTFYREVFCYLKMTIVNFMYCFYPSTICTLTPKADGVPCNGDIYMLRIAYLRGRSLLCVTGYAVGRICFCYGWLTIYIFYSMYLLQISAVCVWERSGSLSSHWTPLCHPLYSEGPGPSGKLWTIPIISIYFKAGVLKVCFYRVLSVLLLGVQGRY